MGASGPQALSVLDLALLAPPAALRARAEGGEAPAQAAYALALRFGLNSAPIDPAAADGWRARAGAARGYTQVTSYTAAFRGQPSRVSLINVPRFDIAPGELAAADRCAAALSLRPDARTGAPADACGGADMTRRLRALWRHARAAAPALVT